MTRKERKRAAEAETALLAPHIAIPGVDRVGDRYKTKCGRWAHRQHVLAFWVAETCHECLKHIAVVRAAGPEDAKF